MYMSNRWTSLDKKMNRVIWYEKKRLKNLVVFVRLFKMFLQNDSKKFYKLI